MENGNRIPDISYHDVYFHQIKCNDMIKYYQKDQQYFQVIYQVGIRHCRPVCLKFHRSFCPLTFYFPIISLFRFIVIISITYFYGFWNTKLIFARFTKLLQLLLFLFFYKIFPDPMHCIRHKEYPTPDPAIPCISVNPISHSC